MTAAFALFSLLIFLMKYNTELIKIKNKGLDRIMINEIFFMDGYGLYVLVCFLSFTLVKFPISLYAW